MRLIDADMLDEEVMHLFITITGTPKQSTVVNECKKSFRKMIDEQPTINPGDVETVRRYETQYLDDMKNPLEPLKISSALKSEIMKLELRKQSKPESISVLDYTIIAALQKVLEKSSCH